MWAAWRSTAVAVIREGISEGRLSSIEASGRSLVAIPQALGAFGSRGWLFAFAGSAAALVLIGIPTAIIQNPFFIRMTPTRGQDYAIWVATAVLAGLIAGTYGAAIGPGQKALASGGILAAFAVGCPICNKLVVLLIGTSGALTFFAPLQLFLGLGALALLAWTLWLRVNALAGSCSTQS